MFLALNMSGFWIYHGSKYARVTQGFEYASICLNNSWIIPVGMAFVLHLPIVIPYLKEPLTVFLKSKNLIFSIVAASNWFAFSFWLNIFASKISDLLLHLDAEGAGDCKCRCTQPMMYPINISVMLFKWFIYLFCFCFFSFFVASKDLTRDSQRL